MLVFFLWIFIHVVVESFPVSSSGHVYLFEQWVKNNYSSFVFFSFSLSHFSHLLQSISACVSGIFLLIRTIQGAYVIPRLARGWITLCAWIVGVDSITTLFFVVRHYVGVNWFPLWLGFSITGIIAVATSFFATDKTNNNDIVQWCTVSHAVCMGIAQSIALLPGISRMGITYMCGRWLGLSSQYSLAISLLIQLPLISAASAVAFITRFYEGNITQLLHLPLLLCTVIAGIVALVGLFITDYLAYKRKWWLFGIYMIIPTVLAIWYVHSSH